jgi:putative DNA primase/helicase
MVVTARSIVEGLAGRWMRRSGVCKCPAHDDNSPSFSVSETRDGRPLVHCFAGCSQGDVIAALRARGLWEGEAVRDPSYPQGFTRKHDGHADNEARRNQEYARDLWERADRIKGTLAEAYLTSRKIKLATFSDALGYLPRLEHKPSGRTMPAMLAALTNDDGRVVAVQRTWLKPDGSGKADVQPAKMTVGPMGTACVRLSAPGDILGIAEGVETALSAKCIYSIPVWATLSANRLSKIQIPRVVKSLVIFADQGNVGMQSAFEAAEVYEQRGYTVDVMPPHVHFGAGVGDFNDALKAGANG